MKQMNDHLSYLIEIHGKKMMAKKNVRKSMEMKMDNGRKLDLLFAKKRNNDQIINIREKEKISLENKCSKYKQNIDGGNLMEDIESKKVAIKNLQKEILEYKKIAHQNSNALVSNKERKIRPKLTFEFDRICQDINKYRRRYEDYQGMIDKNLTLFENQEKEIQEIEGKIAGLEQVNHLCSADFTKSKLEGTITQYKKQKDKIAILEDWVKSIEGINDRYYINVMKEINQAKDFKKDLREKIREKEKITKEYKLKLLEMKSILEKSGVEVDDEQLGGVGMGMEGEADNDLEDTDPEEEERDLPSPPRDYHPKKFDMPMTDPKKVKCMVNTNRIISSNRKIIDLAGNSRQEKQKKEPAKKPDPVKKAIFSSL